MPSCSRTLYCNVNDKPLWSRGPANDTDVTRGWSDAGTFVMVDSDLDDGCGWLGE